MIYTAGMIKNVTLNRAQSARLAAYAEQAGLSVSEAIEKLIPKPSTKQPTIQPTVMAKKTHPLAKKLLNGQPLAEPVSKTTQLVIAKSRQAVEKRDGFTLEEARQQLGL